MTHVSKVARSLKLLGATLLVTLSSGLYVADAAAQPAADPAAAAKQAVAVRKAAFVLIANNFKPIGEVLQGKATYNQAEIVKRSERVAFLSLLLDGTFPDASNLGEPTTKSKPEIWAKKADLINKLKSFR
jgi:cytochrome c556